MLKKHMRAGAVAVLATAGALVFAAPASADIEGDVQNQDSITIPINACGNQVNVIAVPIASDAIGQCSNEVENSQESNDVDVEVGH